MLSLAPCPAPFLWCRFSIPAPTLHSMFDYSLLFVLQFCWGGGGISLPGGAVLDSVHWGVDRAVLRGAHPFILTIDAQADLEQVTAVGRKGATFFQCSVAWGGFPLAIGSGCYRV
jgi:hypothetical protein